MYYLSCKTVYSSLILYFYRHYFEIKCLYTYLIALFKNILSNRELMYSRMTRLYRCNHWLKIKSAKML